MRKTVFTLLAVLFAAQLFARSNRSELSVSYGYTPATDWVDSFLTTLAGLFPGMDSRQNDWGAVTVGYNFRLTERISLGMQVVYSTNESEFFEDGVSRVKVDNSYWSVMQDVKAAWFSRRMIRLYSRLSAGAAFRRAKIDGEKHSESLFAYQLSLIGIEVGGNLAAYAEAGVGVSGCLLVGARYRF
ncbi:hypothetical protein [Alistipes sp.]|uniref:hypothetical protein n=1 Tax=Alistipes sp. TaxID=1872444 RepID=UPI003AF0FFEF